MERSHLQPQVVFRRAAEIEGKSQAALRARLAFYSRTSVVHSAEGEPARGRGTEEGRQTERGEKKPGSAEGRSGMEEEEEEEDIFIYRNKRKTAACPPAVEQTSSTPHV